MTRRLLSSTLFPYTTLFRSKTVLQIEFSPSPLSEREAVLKQQGYPVISILGSSNARNVEVSAPRSEEHTSELQSHSDLVCRLLLEKKKIYWRFNSLNYSIRL